MVKSIVRTYHWPPNVIRGLFIDGIDCQGLVYWYDDIEDQVKESKKPKQK